jgi:hypothetical protein
MFKNTSGQKIDLFAFDYSTGAPKTGDAGNISAYRQLDDGTLTVVAGSAAEIDNDKAKGWYKFDLTQGETDGDKILFSGKSGTANVSIVGQLIYTLPPSFPSLTIADNAVAANVTRIAGSAVNTAAAQLGVNVVNYAGGAVSALVAGIPVVDVLYWRETTVLAPNTDGVPLVDSRDIVHVGTAQAGGTSSITLAASASSSADYYVGQSVAIRIGTGAGQSRLITAYNGGTKIATVAPTWTPPNTDSQYVIVPGSFNLETWRLGIPNALQTNRVDVSVGVMAANVITATSIAADASSEIAAAVRTELAPEMARIDVATSTRASQTSLDTLDTEVDAIKAKTDNLPASPAAVGSQMTVDMTQAVPTSNTAETVGDSLNAARVQGFGKWAIVGTTLNLYAANGTTIVRSFTLAPDATAPISRT